MSEEEDKIKQEPEEPPIKLLLDLSADETPSVIEKLFDIAHDMLDLFEALTTHRFK